MFPLSALLERNGSVLNIVNNAEVVNLIIVVAVIFSWILDSMAAPLSTSSHASVEKYIDVEPDKLSATLDKLFIWEKKLQKEVQVYFVV